MGDRDPEIVVIGSGPNGLVAACHLAMRGLRVLVLECNPKRPGGALSSASSTLPGFVHDVGAAFFPFAESSPAFVALDLNRRGITWAYADIESCHVAREGESACLTRMTSGSDAPLGSERDAEAWASLQRWYAAVEAPLLDALLGTLPRVGPLLELGPKNLWRLARLMSKSGRGLSESLFESEAARRVLPALALHADTGPGDRFGAGVGLLLGLGAATRGFPVPLGGARSITNALVTLLDEHGGKLLLDRQVSRVLVRHGRAVGVALHDGQEIVAKNAVVADTSAPSLFLDLVERRWLPGRVLRKMRRFPQGWGTFKLDLALTGPVPWHSDYARRSAVVHTGENLDDLSRFTAQVRSGALPEDPYLVIGQQSLVDASRAPSNQHTLYVYTHVPSVVAGGWAAAREAFADRVVARIEELAPGFDATILARHVSAPPDLEQENANLRGGDLGGGTSAWHNQLIFRPMFPYFRYATPVEGLYLASSYAHPGTGVHGMCGYNAAQRVLRDLGA